MTRSAALGLYNIYFLKNNLNPKDLIVIGEDITRAFFAGAFEGNKKVYETFISRRGYGSLHLLSDLINKTENIFERLKERYTNKEILDFFRKDRMLVRE